ncbi:hypothetical protein FRC00_003871 [Tulasnella sp. 408]|nr:hypothetical protein FRC00_003871 [Tulasnella sp. 408]
MNIEPPSIPPALPYKELAIVVQATTKDIGKAVELLEAAQQACQQTRIVKDYPREADNATILSRLERLTTLVEGLTLQVSDLKKTVDTVASVPGKVEGLTVQVSDLKKTVDTVASVPGNVEDLKKAVDMLVSVPEKVEDLSNNFGTFAIPIVQETNHLKSLESIDELTVEQLKSYCRKYGLEVGGRKADICQRLCVHLGVGRIAEQKSRD